MIVSAARTVAVVSGANPSLLAAVLGDPLRWPVKAPGATLDYSLNLAAPLADIADVIVSASVAVSPSGSGELAIGGLACAGAVLTATLSGGVPGRNYSVRFDVQTAGGDDLEYTLGLLIDPSLAAFPLPTPPGAGFGTAVTWTASQPLGLNFARPLSIATAGTF